MASSPPGLIFGLLYPDPTAALHIKTFVLAPHRGRGRLWRDPVGFRLFLFQGVPAIIAIILLWIAR